MKFKITGVDREVGALGNPEPFEVELDADGAVQAREAVIEARTAAGRQDVLVYKAERVTWRSEERAPGEWVVVRPDGIAVDAGPWPSKHEADGHIGFLAWVESGGSAD